MFGQMLLSLTGVCLILGKVTQADSGLTEALGKVARVLQSGDENQTVGDGSRNDLQKSDEKRSSPAMARESFDILLQGLSYMLGKPGSSSDGSPAHKRAASMADPWESFQNLLKGNKPQLREEILKGSKRADNLLGHDTKLPVTKQSSLGADHVQGKRASMGMGGLPENFLKLISGTTPIMASSKTANNQGKRSEPLPNNFMKLLQGIAILGGAKQGKNEEKRSEPLPGNFLKLLLGTTPMLAGAKSGKNEGKRSEPLPNDFMKLLQGTMAILGKPASGKNEDKRGEALPENFMKLLQGTMSILAGTKVGKGEEKRSENPLDMAKFGLLLKGVAMLANDGGIKKAEQNA